MVSLVLEHRDLVRQVWGAVCAKLVHHFYNYRAKPGVHRMLVGQWSVWVNSAVQSRTKAQLLIWIILKSKYSILNIIESDAAAEFVL